MTVCAKPTRESPSITSEVRTRLFSASSRPSSTIAAKRALGLDDKKCSDLSSNESLTHVGSASRLSRIVQITEHKGDVTHVASSNRTHNFKDDRIILMTNKVPFYMFSNIPFYKNSKSSARYVKIMHLSNKILKFNYNFSRLQNRITKGWREKKKHIWSKTIVSYK